LRDEQQSRPALLLVVRSGSPAVEARRL